MIRKPKKRFGRQRVPKLKQGKISRKNLVKELDRYFSLYIRARDKRCVLCGTTENLTCGHLFSRVAYSTRWDVGNSFGQCASHNLRHEHDPAIFHLWYIKKFGQESFEKLHEKYSKIRKFSNGELVNMAIYFKQEYEKLVKQSP